MRRGVKCPSASLRSSPAAMTRLCASRQSESVTAGGTAPTIPTRDPTVVSHGMWVVS